MRAVSVIKSFGMACAFMVLNTGVAQAQACEVETFGAQNGQLYLDAENALIVDDNPAAALAALNKLKANELNCYEKGAILGLSAQIKLNMEDYLGAAKDLEASLEQGFIVGDARKSTMLALSQIYFSEDQLEKGLDYMNQWMGLGGQPNRDQKWTMAVVYHKLDRNREALPWAEEVFTADGRDAKPSVYNFLILLYDKTGQMAKKAQLLETLLEREPTNRRLWDVISYDYQIAENDERAFEVQKAMYLAGILEKESELERIVQFYNQFDVPFEAARILEKEMNAGRIDKNFKNMELLATLYQVAREPEKAIPVIRQAADMGSAGAMYERLGRAYSDLLRWEEAERAWVNAVTAGGLRDTGNAWVQIGKARYELDDRAGAREAFRKANNRGGRSWLEFMASEDSTAKALRVFEAQTIVQELKNEKTACTRLLLLGGDNLPEGCNTIDDRFSEATDILEQVQAS